MNVATKFVVDDLRKATTKIVDLEQQIATLRLALAAARNEARHYENEYLFAQSMLAKFIGLPERRG